MIKIKLYQSLTKNVKKAFMSIMFLFCLSIYSQTAEVQIIHNSADPSAEFVDIYLDGTLIADDFEFRNATSFLSVPAGTPINIDVAPQNSSGVGDSIFNLNTTLTANETYIAVANGVLDPSNFDGAAGTIGFGIDVFAGAQQSSTNAGETSVLVHHGSTDAPTVDVRETSVPAGIIVDDISYPEFQGYLDLATQDYVLDVELGDNSAVVASYEAPLQTLGLTDSAITVIASGFLDPSANQSGEAFGLFAALPAGGPLVALPEAPDTAEVQIIHNSADPSAEFVDVYLDGTLIADDFEFRNATSFLEVPAETPINIDVAPQNSSDVGDSIFNLNTTLTEDETYIAVANGVLDPSNFDGAAGTIGFGIDVFAGAQQSSTNAGETSVLVHHGSTDAPTVDVRETSVPAGIIVDDISYPEFQGYLDLATQDYTLDVELGDNSAVVESYEAPLQTLGLTDSAITVVASGFLDPSVNQSGEAFGLFAALPAGGPLVALPEAPDTAEVQIIHNSADPSAEFVDVYLDGTLIADDFEFRNATSFLEVPAETPIDIDVAPQNSSDVGDSIFNLNTTLTEDETYIAVANGVLDPSNFDGAAGTIGFGIDVFAGAQQSSTNAGETSVLVHHGSTDAPTVDVRETSVPAGIIVDDISYTEFQGYLDLANQDYTLDVELGDNSAVVKSYEAPLQTLGLADSAITVVASGFLDPSANQSGEAFGLFASLPAGGALVPLPDITVSTDAFTDSNFNYYPNPVEQKLNISSNGIVEDIQIFNMLGQKIIDLDPGIKNPQINMNKIQPGAYMMKVSVDDTTQSFRVIKK